MTRPELLHCLSVCGQIIKFCLLTSMLTEPSTALAGFANLTDTPIDRDQRRQNLSKKEQAYFVRMSLHFLQAVVLARCATLAFPLEISGF